MPRIVVSDAATGVVEATLSFGAATQKVKKRIRERDAAAALGAAPQPAEARASREDDVPPPRKQKAAPPAAQKAAKKAAPHAGGGAAEPPAARQPKPAKKPKGGDDRPNFAALSVEEQARCVRAVRRGSVCPQPPRLTKLRRCAALCGSRTRRSAAAPFWKKRLSRRSTSSRCRPGPACKGG